MKFSQSVLKLHIPEELKKKREEAKENGVPVADEETLAYLLYTVKTIRPSVFSKSARLWGFRERQCCLRKAARG